MKKYDEYKDSGVAWIGEVPKHWEVGKLKHCSHIVLGKMLMTSPPKGSEGSYTLEKYLKSKNVGWLQLFLEEDNIDEMWFNQYEKSIYKLQENDIVMNEGGDIGKVSCWRGTDFDCYIQNSINKITADYNRVNAGFLCYWLYNLSSLGYFWSIVSQISIAHLTKEKLSNSPVVLPPINEQAAIATYLDTHCAKIDNLISIQQKRIALLQELKQSVITHAVTKGLNPNVEMKQSGVEWIGDVPKHWEVMPIKYIADTNSGATPKNIKGRQNESSDIKWVRTTDLSDICDYVYDSSEYLSREEMKSASCPWLPKNTVVVAMYGGSGTIGKTGILGCDSTINQALCSLETKKLEDYRYLYYKIKSLRPYWMKLAASSRKDPNISQEIIRNMDVPVPEIDEQTKIVHYLDHKCATIDASISNAQHQIDLLQEYKQSLITEVVTGKRKVTDN